MPSAVLVIFAGFLHAVWNALVGAPEGLRIRLQWPRRNRRLLVCYILPNALAIVKL